MHFQGCETRLGRGIAALNYDVIPTRESGRFGHHAETGRVGLGAGINPASRKAIPMHRLYCCSGALRALTSLRVCGSICLHDKTWLPSTRPQPCYPLSHTSQIIHIFCHLIVSPVTDFEGFFNLPKCIHQRGLARPEFILLGDGAIALGDSLALHP